MAKPTKTATDTTAAHAPAPASAPAPNKPAKAAPAHKAAPARRAGKPSVWYKLARALERAEASRVKTIAVVVAAMDNAEVTKNPVVKDALAGARKSLGEAVWTAAVPGLQVLDAERVPAVRPPKPPRFSTGDAVKIAKKFVGKYTSSGLYTPAFLGDLVVDKVSTNGREYICRDPDGAESIHVRYAKHLEAQ